MRGMDEGPGTDLRTLGWSMPFALFGFAKDAGVEAGNPPPDGATANRAR
jgi:hypothetical protein